jgi:AcrR family transcriptional regulator
MNHEALLYSSDEEFAAMLVPFLREAVECGAPAIVSTTTGRIELLRGELGGEADAVSFYEASNLYRRPGVALAAWQAAIDRNARGGAGGIRLVGEVQFGSDEAVITRWFRYESILNRVFADRRVWFVCPYDTRLLPEAIIAQARRTHPVVSTLAGRAPSPAFYGAPEVGAPLVPLEEGATLDEDAALTVFADAELPALRHRIAPSARAAGLAAPVVEDLLVAVTDLARRALVSPAASANVSVGRIGDEWYCQLRSSTRIVAGGLLFAYDLPALAIVRVIADRVELAHTSEGFIVRLVFPVARPDGRERILTAAGELFEQRGVRSTGINAIIESAGVAKATFYSHFKSKDELAQAWMLGPAAQWVEDLLADVEAQTDLPAARLAVFFDVLGERLAEGGFTGAPFMTMAAEIHAQPSARQALSNYAAQFEAFFRRTATEAGLSDVDALASQLCLLASGAVTMATARASTDPAGTARAAASRLLAST